jgi:hypothetical protein
MTTDLTWFPLVLRPRPPGLPLHARITELTALAASTGQGTRQEQATRAAEVLNKAALIASDCGIPGLARELCHRQYRLLAQHAPLPGWAARLAMQPVLNITRQLIRDGNSDEALATLKALHHAALHHTTITVDAIAVDFSTLTSTVDGHRETCTLTWTALLADGIRALARTARWEEAAEHADAYRGTGTRLLDGRQAAILSLLTSDHAEEAAQMVEQTSAAEPWEHAIQAVLRVLCQRATAHDPRPATATMIAATRQLIQVQDPATAVTRTRIGLAAVELAGDTEPSQPSLITALIDTASTDAYAARDLLASTRVVKSLTSGQCSGLQALLLTSGLRAGTIPGHLHDQMTSAVSLAEAALTNGITASEEPEPASRMDCA